MSSDTDSDKEQARQDRPRSFFADLKRRKVFRVLAAYAVVAWLLLQIVSILAEAFPVPDWTMAFSTIVLVLGFPVAAALSWAFQVTPDGVVLDVRSAERLPVDKSRLIHFVDVLIIAALLIVVAFLYFSRATPSDDEIPVAVLPFQNLSEDQGASYLSEGIADDIRARLNGLSQLKTAARSSSKSLYEKGFDVQEIGDRLDVEHVLEGSFQKVDDRIRVTAQLVDVNTGFNRWSKTYDTQFDNVLELQNNISLVVASELEVVLSKETRKVLAARPTEDPRAYDYLLQAKDYLFRPRTDDNLDHAATLFGRAIEFDPDLALGYAGLCRTEVARYMHSGDTAYVESAEEFCDRALTLDASLSDVHTALGEMYLWMGRIDDAEDSFRRAIDINPSAIDAFHGMGDVFAEQGKLVEAEARFRAAIEIMPSNWLSYNQLAWFLFQQNRYVEAIDEYKRVIELTPDNSNAYNNVGAMFYMLGEFDDAADYFRSSLAITQGRAAYSNTGTMYYLAGNYVEAAAMFELAVAEADKDPRLWSNLADAQRFLDGGDAISRISYEKAIQLAEVQIDVSGDDRALFTYLAWFHVNTSQPEAARGYLEKAAAMRGEDAEQAYLTAMTHALLGDAEATETSILKSIELGISPTIINATPELGR
jgi:TolB-like protein/Tfp pilus assembly protein PilF